MNAIQITDLHKSYGTHPVLTGLDLEVPAASFTAILGPSGSGKTTLLRVLAGFQAPDRGTVKIGDTTLDGEGTHVRPDERRIGYVPQEGALFPHLTVQANVAFGLPRRKRREGARELLETVGLTGLEKRYPHQLSGGQQQRVALARALAVKPDVVLLDEPFASLDAHLRATVREEIARILRESSTTTLLVTHDQDEALSLAEEIAVLRKGKIVQCATPQEIYTRPADEELARFIGEANIVEGVIQGRHVETVLGTLPATWHAPLPVPTGSAVNVLVRPEQLILHVGNGTGPAARIVDGGYHGHDSLIRVRLKAQRNEQLLNVRTLGHTRFQVGAEVVLDVQDTVLVWPR